MLVIVYVLCATWTSFALPTFAQQANAAGQSSDPANAIAPAAQQVAQDNGKTVYENTGENTTVAQQAAEQGLDSAVNSVQNYLGDGLGAQNDVYQGLHKWYSDDIVGRLFRSMGELMSKWMGEFLNGWICPAAHFLTTILRTFILNQNTAIGSDDISKGVRQVADIIYGIATDLLLLWFILCTWKYWAEAQWRGMANMLSPVLRLISTAAIMMAWPTLYTFVVQIANEMIQALMFTSPTEVAQLDAAVADSIRLGLVAGIAGLVKGLAPALDPLMSSPAGIGMFGGIATNAISFIATLIFTFLGGVIIVELICIIVLKAIQSVLLLAQYMFAPMFILMFAAPDTEMYTVKFMYGFVAVNLWSFFWLGCLRILVIVMESNYEPWGKLLIAIGALTLMIMAPAFQMAGVIEPTSPFLDPKSWATTISGAISNLGAGLGQMMTANSSYPFRVQRESESINSAPPLHTLPTNYDAHGNYTGGAQGTVQGQQLNTAQTQNGQTTGQTQTGANGQTLQTPTGQQNPTGVNLNTGTNTGANLTPGAPTPGTTGTTGTTTGTGTGTGTTTTGNVTGTGAVPTGATATGNVALPPPKPPTWSHPNGTNTPTDREKFTKGQIQGDMALAAEAASRWGTEDGIGFDSKGNVASTIWSDHPQNEDQGAAHAFRVGAASDNSDAANDAADQAAYESGSNGPQTDEERYDARMAAIAGQDWSTTKRGMWRGQQARNQEKVNGANALINNQKGNAYSAYLRKKYGLGPTMTALNWDTIKGLSTNPNTANYPWAARYQPVRDALAKDHLLPTTENMATRIQMDKFDMNAAQKLACNGDFGALVKAEVISEYGPNLTQEQMDRAVTEKAYSTPKEVIDQIVEGKKLVPEQSITIQGATIIDMPGGGPPMQASAPTTHYVEVVKELHGQIMNMPQAMRAVPQIAKVFNSNQIAVSRANVGAIGQAWNNSGVNASTATGHWFSTIGQQYADKGRTMTMDNFRHINTQLLQAGQHVTDVNVGAWLDANPTFGKP